MVRSSGKRLPSVQERLARGFGKTKRMSLSIQSVDTFHRQTEIVNGRNVMI